MTDLTVKEAGSKGGRSTVQKYSPEELLETRRKGGLSTAAKYGSDHYRALNKKSLEAKKAKKYPIDR